MEDHWLWPLKGGTWEERLIALYYFALLGAVWQQFMCWPGSWHPSSEWRKP